MKKYNIEIYEGDPNKSIDDKPTSFSDALNKLGVKPTPLNKLIRACLELLKSKEQKNQ